MKLVYFLDLVVSGCVSFLGMGSLARLRGLRSLLFCFYYRDKTLHLVSGPSGTIISCLFHSSIPFHSRCDHFLSSCTLPFFSFLRPTWSELIFIAWLILFCYNSNETDIYVIRDIVYPLNFLFNKFWSLLNWMKFEFVHLKYLLKVFQVL